MSPRYEGKPSPGELGEVARSSLGSVGMAIPVQVVFGCADPPVIARFWADALGYQLQGPPEPTAAWRAWLIEHGASLSGARYREAACGYPRLPSRTCAGRSPHNADGC